MLSTYIFANSGMYCLKYIKKRIVLLQTQTSFNLFVIVTAMRCVQRLEDTLNVSVGDPKSITSSS